MASLSNISQVTTANTFDNWRVQTNLTVNDTNEIARGEFTKPKGNVTITSGYVLLSCTSGTMLTVTANARVGDVMSIKNLDQDGGDAYIRSNSGAVNFSNTTGQFIVAGSLRSRLLYNNNFISAANINANGYIETTGTYANNGLILNIANVLTIQTLSASKNVNVTSNITVFGNISASRISSATANFTALTVDSLVVTTGISSPSTSASDVYLLRAGLAGLGDGYLEVARGATSPAGNASLSFASSPGVWRVTANDISTAYSTLITAANLSDSVVTTSSINAATPTAVKLAFDTATAAYAAANSGANAVAVSANNGSLQTAKQLNFINTATVQVSVAAGLTGNANVAFTVVGGGGGGAQGATGTQGTQGSTGTNGTQGTIGAGTQGVQGILGNQGTTGAATQGTTGTQGTVGQRGGVPYSFNSTVNSGGTTDPGSGKITYNNGTFGSVTELQIDNVDTNGSSLTSWFATWDDSTNSSKGYLVIYNLDTGISTIFAVTGAVINQTTHYRVPVSAISGAVPLNAASLSVQFTRTGDIGTQGATGTGTQGATGTGAQGATGTGTQGTQGITGTATQGATGTATQGTQGTTGTATQGATGAGTQGVQGTNGTQGVQGTNGTQGIQGAGYLGIPQNAKTSSYQLIASDAGKHISITTGGVTVPQSVFAVGDAVTIFNNSSSNQTITQGTGVTLKLAASASTGNRTLFANGLATILCVATNTFVASGAGLT